MQIILEGYGPPIPVQPGDTVLASLLRAGVILACRAEVRADTVVRLLDSPER